MTNLQKLEEAAERAHYAPSNPVSVGNWEAVKSDGTGTSGIEKGAHGVWGYKADGGPQELIGWGRTPASAFGDAAKRLNDEADQDAADKGE